MSDDSAPPHGAPSHGRSGPQPYQPYPGAPPVFPSPPGPSAPGPRGGTPVLGILALSLAVLGVIVLLIPLFGWVFGALFLTAAITLAIVALVRREAGKGLSISALIVAGFGVLMSLIWATGFALLTTLWSQTDVDVPDDGYGLENASLAAPDLSEGGTSPSEALPYETLVTAVDQNDDNRPVWEIAVLAPLVVTDDATGGAAPVNGAYLAVPVQITNVSDATIDMAGDYSYEPYPMLRESDGVLAETAYVPAYPSGYELGPVEPDETAVYYMVFDAPAETAQTGTVVIGLSSGQHVHWGPAE